MTQCTHHQALKEIDCDGLTYRAAMSKSEVPADADLVPTKDPLNTTPRPSARQQREKISSLQDEEESTHVYCLSKAWYAAWQALVGQDCKPPA